MSAKQRHGYQTQFPCSNTKKVCTNSTLIQEVEIERLNKKVQELQNALCVAFDDNDTLRNELALMEATLDLARTENEQKEDVIGRLRAIIMKCQFINGEGEKILKKEGEEGEQETRKRNRSI